MVVMIAEDPAVSPEGEVSSTVLAQRFLARYGQFIKDLALSGNFDVLAGMPEFQSFVQDTQAIFDSHANPV